MRSRRREKHRSYICWMWTAVPLAVLLTDCTFKGIIFPNIFFIYSLSSCSEPVWFKAFHQIQKEMLWRMCELLFTVSVDCDAFVRRADGRVFSAMVHHTELLCDFRLLRGVLGPKILSFYRKEHLWQSVLLSLLTKTTKIFF